MMLTVLALLFIIGCGGGQEIVEVGDGGSFQVRYPPGCGTAPAGCQVTATVLDLGTAVNVNLVAAGVNPAPGYVAMALSHDTNMGDDSVMSCVGHPKSSVVVSYTTGHTNVPLEDTLNTGLGREAVFEMSGMIVCNFNRTKIIPSNQMPDKVFQLDKPYHLLFSAGPLSAQGEIQKHVLRFATTNTLDVSRGVPMEAAMSIPSAVDEWGPVEPETEELSIADGDGGSGAAVVGPDLCTAAMEAAVCESCIYGHGYNGTLDADGCPVCHCLHPCQDGGAAECSEFERCLVIEECGLEPGSCSYRAECQPFCPPECHYNVTLASGEEKVVASPGHPHSYPNDCFCTWRVVAPPRHTVRLSFHDFDMEGYASSCQFDRLSVITLKDGAPGAESGGSNVQGLGIYCGEFVPADVESAPYRSMELALITDFSTSGRGFEAVLQSVPVLADDSMFLLPQADTAGDVAEFPTKTGRNRELKKVLWLVNRLPELLEVLTVNLVDAAGTSRMEEFIASLLNTPDVVIPQLCADTNIARYFTIPTELVEVLSPAEYRGVLCSLDLYQLRVDLHDFRLSDLLLEYLDNVTMESTMADVLAATLRVVRDGDAWLLPQHHRADLSAVFPYRWHRLLALIAHFINSPHQDLYIENILSALRPILDMSAESEKVVYVMNNILIEVVDRLEYVNTNDFYVSDLIPELMPTWKQLVTDLLPLTPSIFDILLHSLNYPEFHSMLLSGGSELAETLCTSDLSQHVRSAGGSGSGSGSGAPYYDGLQRTVCGFPYHALVPELADTLGLGQVAPGDGYDVLYQPPAEYLITELAANLNAMLRAGRERRRPRDMLPPTDLITDLWFNASTWSQVLTLWTLQYPTGESRFHYAADALAFLSALWGGGPEPAEAAHTVPEGPHPAVAKHANTLRGPHAANVAHGQALLDILTNNLRHLTASTINLRDILPPQYQYLNARIAGAVDLYPNFAESYLFAVLESPLKYVDQYALDSMDAFCSAQNNVLDSFNFYDVQMAYWVMHYICSFDVEQVVSEFGALREDLAGQVYNYTEQHLVTEEGDYIVDWTYFLSSVVRLLDSGMRFIEQPPMFTDIRDIKSLLDENVRRVLAMVDFERILSLFVDLTSELSLRPWSSGEAAVGGEMSSVEEMSVGMMMGNMSAAAGGGGGGAFSPLTWARGHMAALGQYAESVWAEARGRYSGEGGWAVTPQTPTDGEADTTGQPTLEEATSTPQYTTGDVTTQQQTRVYEGSVEEREERTNVIAGGQTGQEEVYNQENAASATTTTSYRLHMLLPVILAYCFT